MTSIAKALPLKRAALGLVGLDLIVTGVLLAVASSWILGGAIFAAGLALEVVFLRGVRARALKSGQPTFERFGKTFRWR